MDEVDKGLEGHIDFGGIKGFFHGADDIRVDVGNADATAVRPPAGPDGDPAGGEIPWQGLRRRLDADAFHGFESAQNHLAGAVKIIAVADADVILAAALLMGGADEDGVGIDIAVGNDDVLSVVGFDDGGAGLDALDGAFKVVDGDLVPDVEGLAEKDEEAGEPILEDVFEGEADGNGGDAQAGDEISGLEGWDDDGGGEEESDQEHRPFQKPAENFPEIFPLPFFKLAVDAALHIAADEPEDGEHHDGDDDVRKEADGPIHPAVQALESGTGIEIDFSGDVLGGNRSLLQASGILCRCGKQSTNLPEAGGFWRNLKNFRQPGLIIKSELLNIP